MKTLRILTVGAGAILLTQINGSALACAACYGVSDSPMARGMNAGILFLMAVIGTVLASAATFFVFLARRSSAATKAQEKPKS